MRRQLADHLADLTGQRDRDKLDANLAFALRDLVGPQCVSVLRCVGDSGDMRWATRARIGVDGVVALHNHAWNDFDILPAVADSGLRERALVERRAVFSEAPPHLAAFPLLGESEPIGVVEIETACPMDETERRLVAGVLRIFRNFEGLLDYSERDSLTGLLNRKSFDVSFFKATQPHAPALGELQGNRRVEGPGVSHWLGVIDIDHFKRVNDSFGHLIGDEVLILLSRLMTRTFRIHDQLYRFGGEEFVVLMRCKEDGDAAVAFERFRLAVESFAFPQVGRVTVSIGFTMVRAGDNPSGAFERADKAVYHAKQSGRNHVCHHAELVAQGLLVDDTKVGGVELF
jgi:diguanylate cyclase (GGDEF)-like protein